MASGAPAHLWDVEHPYYWNEGNYYKNGCHHNAGTWGDFIAEVADWDMDYNLLCRWDWEKPERGVIGTLKTFWVGQRKASLWSMECVVHPDEEPAVREFLQARLDHLMKLWAPLVPSVAPEVSR
jgi:hypothetical protein